MKFVFSSWYIVLAVLAVAIAAVVALIIVMDRQDKAIIKEFTNGNAEVEPASEADNTAVVEEKQE